MAKPKAREAKAPREGTTRRDRATEAENRLRDYHALGQKVRERVGEGRLDQATLLELEKKTRYSPDILRKSRTFAASYTPEQLDELCRLRRPDGMPLPWGLVRQLLILPAGDERGRLQRQAAEPGWSLEQLVAEIRKKRKGGQAAQPGGRAFKRPKTLA